MKIRISLILVFIFLFASFFAKAAIASSSDFDTSAHVTYSVNENEKTDVYYKIQIENISEKAYIF